MARNYTLTFFLVGLAFIGLGQDNIPELVLSEVVLHPEFNDFKKTKKLEQWVEISIDGPGTASVDGLYLSTDRDVPDMNRLTSISSKTKEITRSKPLIVSINGYKMKKINKKIPCYLEVPPYVEGVYLFRKDGSEMILVDSLHFKALEIGDSWSRMGENGTWKNSSTVTPGFENPVVPGDMNYRPKKTLEGYLDVGINQTLGDDNGATTKMRPMVNAGLSTVKNFRYAYLGSDLGFTYKAYGVNYAYDSITNKGKITNTTKAFQRYQYFTLGQRWGVNFTQRLQWEIGLNMGIIIKARQKYTVTTEFVSNDGERLVFEQKEDLINTGQVDIIDFWYETGFRYELIKGCFATVMYSRDLWGLNSGALFSERNPLNTNWNVNVGIAYTLLGSKRHLPKTFDGKYLFKDPREITY